MSELADKWRERAKRDDVCDRMVSSDVRMLVGEIDRLTTLINAPQTDEFMDAVRIEIAHQRERWGDGHDGMKSPTDWLWNLCYLATKATQAERYGDREKYLHHIITAAALCGNWHRHASLGDTGEPE